MSVYEKLLELRRGKGAGFFVLIDPDEHSPKALAERARHFEKAGVNALLLGGSLIVHDGFHEAIAAVKHSCRLPLILFPGGVTQLSPLADAVLFLSLISGRNPHYLIGEHVQAAPIVKRLGLEVIPTGYMLISSGTTTAVEFISDTKPIPREKPELAAAYALAGQYLGLKLIYLEAGSGAKEAVPDALIQRVRKWVNLPLIVGGGIRTPSEAAAKVKAGADFVVIGTALESANGRTNRRMAIEDFSAAIGKAGKARTGIKE